MTKGIAREPTFCKSGKTLYFSSNQAGNYHIWRLVEGDDPEPVTTGAVTDTSQRCLGQGRLFIFYVRIAPARKSSAMTAPASIASLSPSGLQK